MKKRLLSVLLTVVMVLSLLPTAAFAVTVDNTYQPGTYTASAPGHDDALVTVTLTLAQRDDMVISNLQADGSTQTPRFWAMVEETGLLDSIKNANGTTGVDVVSGATQSSRAVLNAVDQTLAQATSALSGSGTASDPYRIVNAAQLAAFAAAVDGGNTYAGEYVALGANIDLSGIDSWNPIGDEAKDSANIFQGTFDGQGYSISGLTISANVTSGEGNYGLFSTLGNQAAVKSLNVVGAQVSVTGSDAADRIRAGVIAGCTGKAAVSGHANIGARIDRCSATGSASAISTNDKMPYAGGIAGMGDIGTAITNCWTDVDVSGVTDTNNVYAGALYGMDNRVTTVNCYTLGNVTGFSTNPSKVYLGGLAGQGGGIHLNCYSAGDVVSRQVTGDVGILNGRSAGISVQYNSYFNTDAILKQGDTVIAPAKAVGTITTNAVETNVIGKTAAELKSEAFAAQLNSNITASSLNAAIDEILKSLAGQDGRGYTQQNYYEGNKLLSWTVKDNTVVFGSEPVKAVNDMIGALPASVTYNDYRQHMGAVAAARAAYNALSKEQQKLVDTTELEKLGAAIAQFQAVDDVRDKLNDLPGAGDLTINDQEAVKAAREAYDKLTDEQKKYLSDAQVDKMKELTSRMDELVKENPAPAPAPGGTGSGKRPSQSNGKDVKSGSTGDAGITLYVGTGLVTAMACGALVMKRRRKED